MTISGVSSNSYFNYSSYRVTNGTQEVSSSDTDTQQAGKAGRPDGPPPGGRAGGPPPGGGGKGPDLDTDSDGEWSAAELEEYATYSTNEMGIELDADEILTTYDTDSSGSISSDEMSALKEANAFNLPSPKDMMQQMRGFSQPQNIQSASVTSISEEDSDSNASIIQALIDAYEVQSQSMYEESLSTSTTLFEV